MNYTTNTQKLVATGKLSIVAIVEIIDSLLSAIRFHPEVDNRNKAKFELKTIFEIVSLKYKLVTSEWLQLLATLKKEDDPYIKDRSLFIYKQIGSSAEKVTEFLDEVKWQDSFLKQLIEYELLSFNEEINFIIALNEKKIKTTEFIKQMLNRKSKEKCATVARITILVDKLSKKNILTWQDIANDMSYTHFICKFPCWKDMDKGQFINELSIIKNLAEQKGFATAALKAFKINEVSLEFTDEEFQWIIDAAYTPENRYVAFILAAEHKISFEKLKWVKEQMQYRSDDENMKAMAQIMFHPQTMREERLEMLNKLKKHKVLLIDKLVAVFLMAEKVGPEESYSIICQYGSLGIDSLSNKIYNEHFAGFVAA
jgi:hypothetical protein